jgi:hypothetical protein
MFTFTSRPLGRFQASSMMAIALAAGLASCSPPGQGATEMAPAGAPMVMQAPAEAVAADAAAEAPASAGGEGRVRSSDNDVAAPPSGSLENQTQTGSATVSVPMLAYTYESGLRLPANDVQPTLAAHQKRCIDAGPQVCQVIQASSNQIGEDEVRARLELRARPDFVRTFRDGLAAEAKAKKGEVTLSTVTSEDLTRQIVDTEARVKALTSLRDRVQRLLDTRPGKLEELLETERELARVQGELDASRSILEVMRARVAMSTLTINYQSNASYVSDTTFGPIGRAFAEFFGIVAQGVATMIYLLAFVLPFAVIGGPIAWFGLKWFRNRRAKKKLEQTPPA